MSLPKKVKDDDRPRHVRICEQEFRRGFRGAELRIDHESGRARLYDDNRDIVMRMTLEQATECFDALEDEYREHFVHVRDGLYDEDVPENTPDAEPEPAGDETPPPGEIEKLTTSEVRERWPALDEHYVDASSGLGVAARNGHINRSKDGRFNLYHIDEDFFAWLESLPLDEYDVDEEAESEPETGADDEAEGDTAEAEIEHPAHENAAEQGEKDPVGSSGDGMPGPARLYDDFGDTVEYRMERLREAHIAYIDVLHGGSEEEIETEREKVLEAWTRAGRLLERHWQILAETERQVLQARQDRPEDCYAIGSGQSRVGGTLTRITGDQTNELA